jgi:hypothetical protein
VESSHKETNSGKDKAVNSERSGSGIPTIQPHLATMECLTLLLCLAIASGSGRAEVIDDFNSTPKWDGENDPSGVVGFQIIDQELVIAGNFMNATDRANPFNTFGNIEMDPEFRTRG